MAEQFDLPLGGRADTTGRVELFRSYGRFEAYFEDALRMRVVTYCDSPEFILELFDRVESLDQLEVVVGDVEDYRERLIDKPELADRLEQLKRDNRLVIYLCETKEVHSKLYLIEYSTESDTPNESGETGASQQTFEWTGSGSATSGDRTDTGVSEDAVETVRPATAIVGSPNLSSNAWTRQANTGVVFETATNTSLWTDFVEFYEEHRSYNNNGPFLDDLTERLERTSDDRADVVSLYTEGKVKTRDEVSELHGRLDERIESEVDEVDLVLGDETGLSESAEEQVNEQHHESDDSNGESEASTEELDPSDESKTRINLSLLGHSDDAIKALSRMTDYDASLSGDSLTATPQAVQQYKRDIYEVPTMCVQRTQTGDDDPVEFGRALRFHTDGRVYRVGQPLPDDPAVVDTALSDVEGYFETVDKYGNCNDADAVKAHMAEALLWMFWAPFANRDAAFYDQYGIDLDKALPNLYIYGESDAGKGTFAQFALSMISGGRVVTPVDADEVGKRKVRGMRSANTAFPVVVDDITKDTVNRLDTFRNYWADWTPNASFPLFAFISNDKRPNEWFRNR